MAMLRTIHDRFALFHEQGMRVGVYGGFNIVGTVYFDTVNRDWILVQTLHDPSRGSFAPDVAWETRIMQADAFGRITSPGPILVRPNLTQEEILGEYAGIGAASMSTPVWSQRSEEVKP